MESDSARPSWKRSADRILTTHTGSLPRPPDLAGMLHALDTGAGTDPAALDARVRRAVADIVRQQVDAGVDVVSDGEQGKVGYSTYVRHRLTGFDGQSGAAKRADWADFPEAAPGPSAGPRSCARPATGPSTGRTAARFGRTWPTCARRWTPAPTEAFMTAASPGVSDFHSKPSDAAKMALRLAT